MEEDDVKIKTTALSSTESSEPTRALHFVDESTQSSGSVSSVSTSNILNRTPTLPSGAQATSITAFQAESKAAGALDGESHSSEFDFIIQFAHKLVTMMSQAKEEREEIFTRFDELNNKMDILLSKMEGPK